MFQTTPFSIATSTRSITPTTTAFKTNCLSFWKRKLTASPHFWPKIKSESATKSSTFQLKKTWKLKNCWSRSFFHGPSFKCRTPCTTNVYTTKYVQTTPPPVENLTFLALVFDKTLEVGHSAFSIDGQIFLTRLGGSVSSGQTLLLILVTVFGAVQVRYLIPNLVQVIFFSVHFLGGLETQKHEWLFWIVEFHQTKPAANNRDIVVWEACCISCTDLNSGSVLAEEEKE